MKKTKQSYWVGGIVAAVIILIAGAVLYFNWSGTDNSSADFKASEYTAVYLSTGDIYFGKMDWFPIPRMKNVWFIQRGTGQGNQPQYGLAPFKGVFWSPIDEINFNPKEIIFWTKIKDGSELAKALANPSALQAAQNQQNQEQPPTGTTTPQR